MNRKGNFKDKIFGSSKFGNYEDEESDDYLYNNNKDILVSSESSSDFDPNQFAATYTMNKKSKTGGFTYGGVKEQRPSASIYDVNNANYRLGSVNMVSNNLSKQTSAGLLSGYPSKLSNQTDVYGSIKIGGGYNTTSLDKYGSFKIDTNFESKKEDDQPKGKKKKKKFFDDLESQLKKETDKDILQSNDDLFINQTNNKEKEDEYMKSIEQKHDTIVNKKEDKDDYDNIEESNNYNYDKEYKFNDINSPDKESKLENKEEEPEVSERMNNSGEDKSKDEDIDDYSYNQLSNKLDNNQLPPSSNNVYSADMMEEYLKKTQHMDLFLNKPKEKEENNTIDQYMDKQNSRDNSYDNKTENNEESRDKSIKSPNKNNDHLTENEYEDKFEDVDSLSQSNNHDIIKYARGAIGTSQSSEWLRSEEKAKINNDILIKDEKENERMEIYSSHKPHESHEPKSKVEDITAHNFNPPMKDNTNANNIQSNITQSVPNEENLIKNLIAQELGKYLNNLDSLINVNLSSSINTTPKQLTNLNNPGIMEARAEILSKNSLKLSIDKSDNILIFPDNKPKKFERGRLIPYTGDQFSYDRSHIPGRKDVTSMKLSTALDEERKRREYFEISYNRIKEEVDLLESKLRKKNLLEAENEEYKRLNAELDKKYFEMERDYSNLKDEYDRKLKIVEERIALRESRQEARKISELQRKFEIDIENIKEDLKEKMESLAEYKNKCDFLEKENTKLSLSRTSIVETNEKIKELRNENFILHEKFNELTSKYEKLQSEVTLKQKEKTSVTLQTLKNEILGKEISKDNSNEKQKSSQLSVFDQITLERELNAQEAIIRSYTKEIERLNHEIKFLTNVAGASNTDKKKNNFVINNEASNFVKESAEEKVKLLQKILKDNQIPNELLENEFRHVETVGEITIDNFLHVMKERLKIQISRYELMEIFNNYRRSSGNKILVHDFLNSLQLSSPVSCLIQPDPSYLRELETKLSASDKKIIELEKFIVENAAEEEDLKNKLKELTEENTILKDKIRNNPSSGSCDNNLLGLTTLLTNNFLNQNKETKLKEKIRSLESTNEKNIKDFYNKIEKYEGKVSELEKLVYNKEKVSQSEVNVLQNQISCLTEENTKLKLSLIELETNLKNTTEKYSHKINKYKHNYKLLKEKMTKLEKDKEKIILTLKDKNISAESINNYINNLDEIKILNTKLAEMEDNNRKREEHYKQLCHNVNTYQMNKEIDAINKKFELERKEYCKIISHKNSELQIIRKEFEEILKEINELKLNKRIR